MRVEHPVRSTLAGGGVNGKRNGAFKPEEPGRRGGIPPFGLRTRNSKGFTLLEVMIAVAILAMVLVSLLGVKNRSTVNVMLADRITTATLLAKRMMTDTLASGQLKETDDHGAFDEDAFKDYTWERTVAPLPVEDVKILEVRVAVLWKEGTRQEKVELVSYE